MEEFPHLVQMQKKYGKDGFQAISVSLDDVQDKVKHGKDLRFLQKQNATFPNVIRRGEMVNDWLDKLGYDGVPIVYVFDRANHWVKKYPVRDARGEPIEDARYAIIEKLVVELLQK